MLLSVCVITAVLCVTADAQDEPRITQEIWPEIKRVGMTGYLNCTVTRQSNNKVCYCVALSVGLIKWMHKYNSDCLVRIQAIERLSTLWMFVRYLFS